VTVGRGADCDIRVDHPSASRQHAALIVEASLAVQDLGSSNGRRVDGPWIAPQATVQAIAATAAPVAPCVFGADGVTRFKPEGL
jgi:pSer/pThr/pTyr-binding forkhead associated (FHA) protein